MTPSQPPRRPRLRRRSLLGMPVLAAVTVTGVARPAPAEAAPKVECVADLIRSS